MALMVLHSAYQCLSQVFSELLMPHLAQEAPRTVMVTRKRNVRSRGCVELMFKRKLAFAHRTFLLVAIMRKVNATNAHITSSRHRKYICSSLE